MAIYKVIGLMSGSSLDGLDIAWCQFIEDKGKWDYKFLKTTCVAYTEEWRLKLAEAASQDARAYVKTSAYYGKYLADVVNNFIINNNVEADLITVHGHTVFHQPENLISSQIGDGAVIASMTGLPVVTDLRSCDVVLGGQGAPIVPIGDKHLFPDYTFCLNLGGIVNISAKMSDDTIAGFDICPLNTVLNSLAKELEHTYDEDGNNARNGTVNDQLLDELNNVQYYKNKYPKSLGMEMISKVIQPVLSKFDISVEDKLRTFCEHAAFQIAETIKQLQHKDVSKKTKEKVLITGGGALNKFLVERIKIISSVKITIPNEELINFKEALITGFFGILRIRSEKNCLSSVTGASKDVIGGAVYLGNSKKLLI